MAARFICEVAVAQETNKPGQWQHEPSVKCAAGTREEARCDGGAFHHLRGVERGTGTAREKRSPVQWQRNSSVRWLWRERQTSPVQWQHDSSVECAAGAREKKPGVMHGSAIHLGGGARSRPREEEEEEARCNGWQRDSSVRCAWCAIGTGTEKKPKPSAMAGTAIHLRSKLGG